MTQEKSASPPPAAETGIESPRGFGRLLRKSGPAFLAGGLNIGAATVTNSVLLASATGFVFGWVFIPAVLATYAATLVCVRITAVAQRDPIDAIRTFVSPAVGVVNGVAIILVNLVFFAVNAVLAGAALNALIPAVPTRLWAGIAIVITAVLALLPGRIGVVSSMLKWLIIGLALAYLASLFVVPVDWLGFLQHTFTPTLPTSQAEVLLFTAVLGSALAINVPVAQAYASRASGYGPATLRLARFETGAANLILFFVQIAVLAVVASTLFPQGLEVTSALAAASALEPIAGPFATALFALGLLGACISTLIVQTQVTGYVTADLLGWDRDLGSRRFKTVQVVMLGAGLLIPLLNLDPFSWTPWGAAFNSTFMPIGIATWWYLANKTSIMGRYRAGVGLNILIGIAMLIATTAALRFWYVTLFGG